jgi:hypothetical protein
MPARGMSVAEECKNGTLIFASRCDDGGLLERAPFLTQRAVDINSAQALRKERKTAHVKQGNMIALKHAAGLYSARACAPRTDAGSAHAYPSTSRAVPIRRKRGRG